MRAAAAMGWLLATLADEERRVVVVRRGAAMRWIIHRSFKLKFMVVIIAAGNSVSQEMEITLFVSE